MYKVGSAEPVWFEALWDTGATHTVITQRVVDACGLVSDGPQKVYLAYGETITDKYVIDLSLPNGLRIDGLVVTRGDFSGADLLIGMDVIAMGDFAVTNHAGQTKFTFRVPSQGGIDFVLEARQAEAPGNQSDPS